MKLQPQGEAQNAWRFRASSEKSKFIHRLVLATIAAGLITLVAGCGAKMAPIHYYDISYPTAVPASPDPLNVTLLVRALYSSHLYHEDRIVYGLVRDEMGAYENERWAEPPTEIMQMALVRGLRASGRFRRVSMMRSDTTGDFLLSGHLYEFNEESVNGLKARLNYDVELRDLKAGKIVWTYAYNHDEPSDGKTVASTVAAMDKNVQLSVQEIQTGREEYFKNHPVP